MRQRSKSSPASFLPTPIIDEPWEIRDGQGNIKETWSPKDVYTYMVRMECQLRLERLQGLGFHSFGVPSYKLALVQRMKPIEWDMSDIWDITHYSFINK